MYIDIHRHSSNKGKADVVLRNLFHSETSQVNSEKYCSVGLHPWHVQEEKLDIDLKNVYVAAEKSNVLAVGEVGIDKSRSIPINIQEYAFKEQLNCAIKNSKPLIIHCVRAYSELSQIRRVSKHKQAWIFHWFNASTQMGLDLVQKGCYLSFGHMLFYETSKAYKAFTKIPVENIFFETDDSNWTIQEVYEKGAELRKVSLKKLKDQIKENFTRVFSIKP